MVEWAAHINAATEEEIYANGDDRNIKLTLVEKVPKDRGVVALSKRTFI